MRSKTSYFNPTLFKKNLTRFWPLWGGASALGALIPLALFMILVEDRFAGFGGHPLEFTHSCYVALCYFVPTISLLYAALCALAVWGWLYNPRSVGMMHSLPVTRKGLFVTNVLSGLAMMLIPYAVTGALVILLSLVFGLFEPVGILVTILGVLADSFFYFASATLVVFLTGNPFAFAAFYFIFHFLATGAEWLVSQLMAAFYFGVGFVNEGVIEFLSPTIYLTRRLHPDVTYQTTSTPDGWIDNGVPTAVELLNGYLLLVYALVGAVLLALAWALYRRRRSESAGDVVAVGWMKPIFRYGVALCAAAAGGMLLYGVLFSSLESGSIANPILMAICMAVAGVVGYYIASMLLVKSLRVFQNSLLGALATAAAALILCFTVAADPAGVEAWLPEADSLENLSLYVSGPYGRSIGATLTDEATIQKILDCQAAIVAEKDVLDDSRGEKHYAHVYLTYRQNGRRTAWRSYDLRFTPELLEESDALIRLQGVLTDPVVQEDNIFGILSHPFGYSDDLQNEIRLTGGYVGDVYDTQTQEIYGSDLLPEQAKALETAVRRDIQAGHFGKTVLLTNLMPDENAYHNIAYFGDLTLNYTVTKLEEGKHRTYSRTVSFGISVYCTETVKALEDMGVLDGTHKLLTMAEHGAQQAQQYPSDVPYDSPSDGPYVSAGSAVVYPEEAMHGPA
jgi:ABC-2 type transport system permease protein